MAKQRLTGFKPSRQSVSVKWGTRQTGVIPKNLIGDYQRLTFESIIERFEELQAYIYEDATFLPSHSILEEDGKYHRVFMNSADFDDWELSEGGTYYVEVGKDIDNKCKSRAKVSIKNNSTNLTLIVEQDVTKIYTFYEYDQSSVEYYYYKDCIIMDFSSHSGLIVGGTQVSLFNIYDQSFPKTWPFKRLWWRHLSGWSWLQKRHQLNNTVYEPSSVSWKQIRCPMPRAQGGEQYFGQVDLAVSPNGKDWDEFIGGFQYYPQPVVEDISPRQGPNLGVGIIKILLLGLQE